MILMRVPWRLPKLLPKVTARRGGSETNPSSEKETIVNSENLDVDKTAIEESNVSDTVKED